MAIAVVLAGAGAYVLVALSDFGNADEGAEETATSSSQPASERRSDEPAVDVGLEDGVELEGRSYERGDCVTWDVEGARPREISVVVDCEKPHRFEVSGTIQMAGDAYPTAEEWDAVLFDECRELNEALFGGPLDPAADVEPTSIQPGPDGWEMGERTVYCGLSRIDPLDPTTEVLVTGLLRHSG